MVLIWAGVNLYQMQIDQPPKVVEFDDEIHAVYSIESLLCVVCELSVRLLDPGFRELDRIESDCVLGRSWWHEQILNVQGEEHVLQICVLNQKLELKRT